MTILRVIHGLLFEVGPWLLMLGGILLFGSDLVSWLFRRRDPPGRRPPSSQLLSEIPNSQLIPEPGEEP